MLAAVRARVSAGDADVRGRRVARRQRAAQLARPRGQRRAAHVIAAAAAVSTPLDLMAAGIAIGQGLNRIYTQQFPAAR